MFDVEVVDGADFVDQFVNFLFDIVIHIGYKKLSVIQFKKRRSVRVSP